MGALACLAVVSCHWSSTAGNASPAASVSSGHEAPPAPLDTSWQRDPARLLAAGDLAPDFEGIAHTGMRVRLSAFLSKPVVVYFYGADKTPAAVAEATGFRDAWLHLNDKIGMILGVSADDRIMHRDFATEEDLPFLLVADDKLEIARAFGVPIDGGRARPTTFIVGSDGKVVSVFTDSAPEKHVTDVMAALGAK